MCYISYEISKQYPLGLKSSGHVAFTNNLAILPALNRHFDNFTGSVISMVVIERPDQKTLVTLNNFAYCCKIPHCFYFGE